MALEISYGSETRVEFAAISDFTTVTTLVGEHDLATEHMLVGVLASARLRPNIIVDLTRCTFVESTIFAVLFVTRSEHRQRDARLELVIPEADNVVNRAVSLLSVRDVFRVHQTLPEALLSLGEPVEVSAA